MVSYGILDFRAKKYSKIRSYCVRCKSSLDPTLDEEKDGKRKFKILIAGGGIGGLVLALAAKHRGFEVEVFEKDLSLVRGEGQHRGPIQLMSSALAVLEAIDENVAKQIMAAGCVTGNRTNGFVDGVSASPRTLQTNKEIGTYQSFDTILDNHQIPKAYSVRNGPTMFTKFDLSSPAVSRGLPITQVICRMELQDILVNAVGLDIVRNNSEVVDFIEEPSKVTVILEDGRQYHGDVLVGADGIWSNVRTKLFGRREAKYSNYTCYSGITKLIPPYIDSVGYRVFLGLNQYFAADCSNSGNTRVHDFTERNLRQRHDLLLGIGRVALLGDAAHPLQPNLGQGGCMAIDDCYQLIDELDQVPNTGSDAQISDAICLALRQ
ncbi:Zeaxanthin epoxidase, chloroplastic [Prunus dulcis]|uniref:Zeaxanthin epoxidase, chloroplastic n=1 Tax=Prunus dulcis TaxID=3755 RepID=A0A4Y1QWR5_PRUDU|nr:Zeaxanthin epoxidase, chloroplastic [Prunus dulcis]